MLAVRHGKEKEGDRMKVGNLDIVGSSMREPTSGVKQPK